MRLSWKDKVKINDLSDEQKLEVMCKECGATRYISKELVLSKSDLGQLYISELELRMRCKQRGCKGTVRLAQVRLDELTGFVGGMA